METDIKPSKMVATILATKGREEIIALIDQAGDAVDWEGWTAGEILEECQRSDAEAGEEENGLLAHVYYN